MITQGTLENPSDCGVYRTRYVVVGNRLTGEVVFRPPANEDAPKLMKALIAWVNSNEAQSLDQIIETGIAHYEFVRIHPFVDGNGRTVRVLAALILYLKGFDTKQFFCLDDYYDSDRPLYYRILRSVDQKTLDITRWLEYFVEGVKVSIAAVKDSVVRLSSERLRKTMKGQIALTEKQMKIVEFINQNDHITNRNVQQMFKISSQAAHKELVKLVQASVIEPIGKGRSLVYRIKLS
jgi:Fic family protein